MTASAKSNGNRRAAVPQGGGFLAGALQTAVGVAGGMLLGNMLGGLFRGNDAHAAEAPPDAEAMPDDVDDAPGFGDDFGDFDV